VSTDCEGAAADDFIRLEARSGFWARRCSRGEGRERTREGKLRSRWGSLPLVWKILTVSILPTIAAVITILGPFGVFDSHPSGFQGYVLGPTGHEVRKSPKLSGPVVTVLPPDTVVYIVCTKKGDAVKGPRHGGGIIESRIWDYVQTANSTGPIGFIADAYVNTGGVKAVAHPC
jgi:hypothetical protein